MTNTLTNPRRQTATRYNGYAGDDPVHACTGEERAAGSDGDRVKAIRKTFDQDIILNAGKMAEA